MPEDDRKIASARKDWEERKLNPSLKRGAERKPKFVTSSGIEVKRTYDPDDLNGQDFVDDLGFPGEYPFTRGVQPTMYRGRLWTMRQYAGFGSAEESNRRYRYLFEQPLVALVGFLRGAEAAVLAHRPQPSAIHRGLHTARERIAAGQADILIRIEMADTCRRVQYVEFDT